MERKRPNRMFLHTKITSSTNDDIKKMIYSDFDCAAVLCADSQSGGRGRLGRSFLSPDGGIYFSAAYPLSGQEKNIAFLTLAAGLAVAETLEESASDTVADSIRIKWPNDIYINGKKVCGILTELCSLGGHLSAAVGIGINSKTLGDTCPDELKDKITTLFDEGIFPSRDKLIRDVIKKLDRLVYSQNVLDEVPDDVTASLNSRSYIYGKEIMFFDGDIKKCGTASFVERDGSLRVLTADGTAFVKFGEVTEIIRPKNT